jgi:hypothetical protein
MVIELGGSVFFEITHDLVGDLFRAKNTGVTYEHIDACVNGCVLFRKEHTDATHCLKCQSSRFEEVPAGDGQMKQTDIKRSFDTFRSCQRSSDFT